MAGVGGDGGSRCGNLAATPSLTVLLPRASRRNGYFLGPSGKGWFTLASPELFRILCHVL